MLASITLDQTWPNWDPRPFKHFCNPFSKLLKYAIFFFCGPRYFLLICFGLQGFRIWICYVTLVSKTPTIHSTEILYFKVESFWSCLKYNAKKEKFSNEKNKSNLDVSSKKRQTPRMNWNRFQCITRSISRE